jgi:sarcosine oxidase, subunit beta
VQNSGRPSTTSHSTAAVVGAGITGLSIAYELASRGIDVVVLERDGIGAGASGVQPGGVRQQWGTRVNCGLARESLEFYRDVAANLDAPSAGRFTPCGYVFIAHAEERLEAARREVALQQAAGVPSVVLEPDELAALVPGLDVTTVCGAAYCAEDGYFDNPQGVVEAYATAAQRLGARIERFDVARLAEATAGWRLEAVDGAQHHADVVVVAAAWETPSLVAPLGVVAPIVKEPRFLFFSEPIRERLLDPLVVSAERAFAAKHLANGRVLASDLSARGDLATGETTWRQSIKGHVRELLPILEYVDFSIVVEGFYDVTPDNQPIVGPLDSVETLWVAAGFSGHGFMLAPAISRAVANLLVDRTSHPLFEDFRLGRFDGAELTPELQVV